MPGRSTLLQHLRENETLRDIARGFESYNVDYDDGNYYEPVYKALISGSFKDIPANYKNRRSWPKSYANTGLASVFMMIKQGLGSNSRSRAASYIAYMFHRMIQDNVFQGNKGHLANIDLFLIADFARHTGLKDKPAELLSKFVDIRYCVLADVLGHIIAEENPQLAIKVFAETSRIYLESMKNNTNAGEAVASLDRRITAMTELRDFPEDRIASFQNLDGEAPLSNNIIDRFKSLGAKTAVGRLYTELPSIKFYVDTNPSARESVGRDSWSRPPGDRPPGLDEEEGPASPVVGRDLREDLEAAAVASPQTPESRRRVIHERRREEEAEESRRRAAEAGLRTRNAVLGVVGAMATAAKAVASLAPSTQTILYGVGLVAQSGTKAVAAVAPLLVSTGYMAASATMWSGKLAAAGFKRLKDDYAARHKRSTVMNTYKKEIEKLANASQSYINDLQKEGTTHVRGIVAMYVAGQISRDEYLRALGIIENKMNEMLDEFARKFGEEYVNIITIAGDEDARNNLPVRLAEIRKLSGEFVDNLEEFGEREIVAVMSVPDEIENAKSQTQASPPRNSASFNTAQSEDPQSPFRLSVAEADEDIHDILSVAVTGPFSPVGDDVPVMFPGSPDPKNPTQPHQVPQPQPGQGRAGRTVRLVQRKKDKPADDENNPLKEMAPKKRESLVPEMSNEERMQVFRTNAIRYLRSKGWVEPGGQASKLDPVAYEEEIGKIVGILQVYFNYNVSKDVIDTQSKDVLSTFPQPGPPVFVEAGLTPSQVVIPPVVVSTAPDPVTGGPANPIIVGQTPSAKSTQDVPLNQAQSHVSATPSESHEPAAVAATAEQFADSALDEVQIKIRDYYVSKNGVAAHMLGFEDRDTILTVTREKVSMTIDSFRDGAFEYSFSENVNIIRDLREYGIITPELHDHLYDKLIDAEHCQLRYADRLKSAWLANHQTTKRKFEAFNRERMYYQNKGVNLFRNRLAYSMKRTDYTKVMAELRTPFMQKRHIPYADSDDDLPE